MRRSVEIINVMSISEINSAFASLAPKRIDALLVDSATLFVARRVELVTLAAHHRIPAIYPRREFSEIGGLMSYGSDLADQWRQVGIYTGRILIGEKPSDLPVMRPTKFELVINTTTAKTLGIAVPETLLATALSGYRRSQPFALRDTSLLDHLVGRDHDHSGRLQDRPRSGSRWSCEELQPAWRQHHRHLRHQHRPGAKTAPALA
jgi:hypothetical protein